MSGVRPRRREALCQMLNAKVHPVCHRKLGGRSGDLARWAFAHVVIGDGSAEFHGEVLPGGEP